jgi:hypothetical protein
MNVRLRRFGLIGIVAAAACTPFGPATPDGGDAGSSSTSDSSSDTTSDVPQDLASEQPDGNVGLDVGSDSASANPDSAGQANGTSCGDALACGSGHCVEGTCCEAACANGCFSCLESNTGQLDGKCAPVEAGRTHASDCTASDPATCGLDGKCDGAGACRKYVAGTACAAESCADTASVSNYNSARTCDGHGACSAATTSQCGSTYRCSGTKCRTTCDTAQDCASGAYCSGTTCVAKKPDGEVCSSASECLTGVCGGLCCAAGCNCPQPDPTNVLKNPGIDKDTSGWMVDVGTLSRSLSDADLCPYSGSLLITNNTGQGSTLRQCVTNTPLEGTFDFGAKIRSNGGIVCQVLFYSGFNCDGDEILDNETHGTNGDEQVWESPSPEGELAPISGANSVSFTCYVGGTETYLDQLYVSKSPAAY